MRIADIFIAVLSALHNAGGAIRVEKMTCHCNVSLDMALQCQYLEIMKSLEFDFRREV